MLKQILIQLTETVLEALALAAIMTMITPGASFSGGGSKSFGSFLTGFLNPNQVPHASGGIFTGPTQIGNHLFGEQGPEMLIPLDRMGEFANGPKGGMGGGNLTCTVTGEELTFVLNRTNQRRGRIY